MIPFPCHVERLAGALPLSATTRIVVGDPALLPLARQLTHELAVLAKTGPAVVEGPGRPGDIALALDAALPDEGYVLETVAFPLQRLARGQMAVLDPATGGAAGVTSETILHVHTKMKLRNRPGGRVASSILAGT